MTPQEKRQVNRIARISSMMCEEASDFDEGMQERKNGQHPFDLSWQYVVGEMVSIQERAKMIEDLARNMIRELPSLDDNSQRVHLGESPGEGGAS